MKKEDKEGGKRSVAFVTGGTGFIGSHLVESLIESGYEVRCLVRSRLRWLEGLPIVRVDGNIEDTASIREALSGVDVVYHVGGITRATNWSDFQKANIDTPLLLLDLIAEVAPKVERVVITSSLAAVGACDGGEADELSPLRPISDYGRSKALMEEALHRRNRPNDPPITIIRPPAVYGPREADIYTYFQSVSRGIAPVVGSGTRPDITLVHVRDLVRGMIAAAESERAAGQTYFIGTERPFTWNEIKVATTRALDRSALSIPVPQSLIKPVGAVAEFVGKLAGFYPPLNRQKAREIRYACKMCSSLKAAKDFGYQSEVGLRQGIAETIQWYRKQGLL